MGNLFTSVLAAAMAASLLSPAAAADRPTFDAAFWSLDTAGRGSAAQEWLANEPGSDEAAYEVALFTWQFNQDAAAALQVIDRGLSATPDSGNLWRMKARIHSGEADHAAAIASAHQALTLEPFERQNGYVLGAAYAAAGQNKAALEALRALAQTAPGHLAASLLRIRLGVEDQFYRDVSQAWSDIGVVGFGDPFNGGDSSIDQWEGLARDLSPNASLRRAELLEHWHFYHEAALEYERAGETELAQRNGRIAQFQSDIQDTLTAYYLRRARGGNAVEAELFQNFWPQVAGFMTELGIPLADETLPPIRMAEASLANLAAELRWVINVGDTNDHLDVHLGHVVSGDPQLISQWGEEAEVDSVTLFNMVSNGYSAWFWDAAAGDGGWVTRPEGNVSQLRRFVDVLDPKFGAALSRTQVLMEQNGIAERRAAWQEVLAEAESGAVIGYDDRVDDMLRLRAVEPYLNLHDDLLEARRAANAAVINHFIQTSTVIHEGQHVLDIRDGFSGEQWVLEYRAKLAELAYGERPFFSLATFYSNPSIAGQGGTPHADAEVYLMAALAEEITANAGDYSSIDPQAELWVQLPGLSVDDLRRAARRLFHASDAIYTNVN